MKQVLIAIDQFFNALLGGMADETLSANAYRQSKKGKTVMKRVIDTLFFFDPDHCYNSYLSEMQRKQLPKEYSNDT